LGDGGGRHLILYDGVCGLCNRLVRFVLRRDRAGIFIFASLQGRYGRRLLESHGRGTGDLDTFAVVVDHASPRSELLVESPAALFVLEELGGGWRLCGRVLRVFPGRLLDLGYDLVARHRYRVFGRHETCPVPRPEERSRFVDPGE
jgi:predicted DCC family thiol-disulfide oxidoreductase YuxK